MNSLIKKVRGMASGRRAVTAVLTCILISGAAHAGSGRGPWRGEDDPNLTGPLTAPVDRRYAAPRNASALAADSALQGEWTTLEYPTTVRAIHVTLLRTGKVLLAAGSGNVAAKFAAGSFTAELWDPVTHTLKQVPPPWDMFCAGHVVEPDGNVFVMGGTTNYQSATTVWTGSNKAYSFNTETELWEERASMAKGRWYPTAILDPTGEKILVYSGRDEVGANPGIPEVYDRTTGTWSFLPLKIFPMYPALLWTAKAQIYFSGAATGLTGSYGGILSPYTGVYKRILGGIDMTRRNAAATVFAGDVNNQLAWLAGGGFPATDTTVLTDLKPAIPVSVAGPLLPTAKAYVSAVNLPDLTVLETGGGTARLTPVYEASIFDPTTRTITPVAAPTVARTYHSSGILLPDGSVATFGGDFGGKNFDLRIEIFKPPYFFRGPRPVISEAPVELNYGASYPVAASATDAALRQAVLIRPSSTTHSTDANQRSILIGFEHTPEGGIITLPTSRNIAPPGWYMLFVNDSLGRPSTATWVHLT